MRLRAARKMAFEGRTGGRESVHQYSHFMTPANIATSHFFTVDVEEYFQVRALESVVPRAEWPSRPTRIAKNVDALLALLESHDVKATFFVLGWVGQHRSE